MASRNGIVVGLLLGLTCACGSATGTGGASGTSAVDGGGTKGGTGGTHAVGSTGGTSSGGSSTGSDADTPGCGEWTSDAWRLLSPTSGPSAREQPWLVPTDDGMIVFGGYNHQVSIADPFLDDGAMYHLCDDSWTPMSTAGVPHAITDTVAQRPLGLWTGSDLLVWGGFQGALGGEYEEGGSVSFATRYGASSDAWSDMKREGEPTARDFLVRVWTGEKLLVWGGIAQSGEKSWVNHDDGALYDPKTDSWKPMSKSGALAGRYATDRALWTGDELIVWGGLSYATGMNYDPAITLLDDGGVYDVASDTWTAIPKDGAPHGGLAPFAWTGKELIVISKLDGYSMPGKVLFEGALFDPASKSWSPMSAPSPEIADMLEFANLKLYWVGDVLAVFGTRVVQGGGPTLLLYDPRRDAWSSGTVPSTPQYSSWQSATVVGNRLVVIGPGAGSADDRGAHHESTAVVVFDPKTRDWTSLPAALNRSQPGLVARPSHLMLWGGKDIYTDVDAPNPCLGAATPCDPITPTVQTLLADGVGISY
jgi:hypothetical protein